MNLARLFALALAPLMGALATVPQFSASVVSMTADPTLLAETSVAIDPTNEQHLVVLADRYTKPTTIVMAESFDGGVPGLANVRSSLLGSRRAMTPRCVSVPTA